MRPEIVFDIVILASNDLSHDRRLYRTCRTLQQEGWQVLLMGRLLEGSRDLQVMRFDTHRVLCKFQSGPLFYAELIYRFKTVLKKLEFKRLLCTDEDTLCVLHFIDTSKIEIYFDAHELFTEVPELQGHPIKKRIWNQSAKRAIKKVNHAYTVNISIAEILEKKYKKKFQVVRNAPKLRENLAPKENPEKDLMKLVYIGVLNPDRGLDLLIQAVRQREGFELAIIGLGPEEDKLKKIAGHSDKIQFLGQRASHKIPELIREHDIGVNLLNARSQSYYYSLANKFFDYLHAGLPVMCMNFPEYARINEEFNCIYPVEGYSLEHINESLDRIARDSNYQTKSAQAIQAAKKYNWQNEEQKFLEIYGF